MHIFHPKDAIRMGGGYNKNVKGAGINHPNGSMIYYYIKSLGEKDTVSLSFKDSQGGEIITYSNQSKDNKLTVKEGSNSFVWNLYYPSAERFKGLILWAAGLQGARAIPGDYSVELTHNGKSVSENLKIVADPRMESSLEDLKAQFDFVQEVNLKVTEAHSTIKDIRLLKEQLSPFKNKKTMDAEVVEMATMIDSSLNDIENELYQTKNRSRQDPLNFPIKLTNKIGALNSITSFGDFPPTDQAIIVKGELMKKINDQLALFYQIRDEKLPEMNQLIRSKSVDVIAIPAKEE
jgi:hypothetical protein